MNRWLLPIGVMVLGLVLGLRLAEWRSETEWTQAQEFYPTPETAVTEAEVELYIAVYSAMQADHDLTIQQALERRGESLDRFRDIERRVQSQERLVDRVRLALLNQAKSRSAIGQDPGPQPSGTPERQ